MLRDLIRLRPQSIALTVTRAAALDFDHRSIQGNAAVNEAAHGNRVLHARRPYVLGSPVVRSLSSDSIPRPLRQRLLSNLERVLVCDRVLLVRNVKPTGSEPHCQCEETGGLLIAVPHVP